MSNVKSLSRNATWLTIAELFGKAVAFVAAIFITRYLTKEDFGQYSFVLAFGLLFGVLANFGFGAYTTREIAKNRKKAQKIIGNLLSLKLILSALVLLFMFVSTQLIDRPMPVIVGLYVVGFLMVFDALRGFISSVFQAYEEMQFVTLVRVGERFMYLALIGIVILLKLEFVYLLIALLVSSITFSCIGLLIVHTRFARVSLKFDRLFLKDVLINTFFFVLNDVFIVVFFKIDSVMLTFMKGDIFNAEYTAAYNVIYSSVVLIPAILSSVLYPVLTRFFNKDKELFRQNIPHILKYYLLSALPFMAFFLIFAPYLLDWFYAGKYNNSLTVFYLLTFGVVFVFLNFVLSTVLNTIEKQKLVALASFVAMIFNVSVNFLLIPDFGIIGAGVATVITELLFCIGLFYYVQRELRISSTLNLQKLLKISVSFLFAGVCAYVLIFNPFVSLIAFVSVFGVMLFLLGMFTQKDQHYLEEALSIRKA